MGVALAQEGAFGLALQTQQGTYVAPSVWLPLMSRGERGETLKWRKNYVTLDMADTNDFASRYFSTGEWVEGQITVPLIPGSLTALLSWIQDRDQDNQGKWASLVVDCVNEVKQVTDAKVRRATISMVKGEPVMCTLDVLALKMQHGTPAAATMPTAAPYLYREAGVEIASGGGALEEDVACEQIRIAISNMVEDAAEGLRLVSGVNPRHLYNLAGVRCQGELSRDFVDSALYADFAAGQEAALRVELTRGASTATLSLPRVLYTESDLGLPGSHEQRIVETVKFLGLGSVDGLAAPVVLG
jgi:hypothetical protein